MRTRTLILTSTALASTLFFVGCAQNNESNSSTSSAEGSSSTSSPAFNEQFNAADEMFVTMMIPHHEQAIEMSDLILSKDGIDTQVTALAQQIKDAQGPEITTMKGWLKDWGVSTSDSSMGGMDHGNMDHGGGMMSDDSMTALKSATGVEATKLFIIGMIEHHEGAIDMAQAALDGGQNPDVLKLAQQVIDGQSKEITTMQDILTSL